ncbi:hypothetical protein FA95DRAFT_1651004 [Auriscalpium vulgare]|uniref:Uncharacterized protein n=1 Tax=Auriscalpium vulgare TaxID=40419 RepID=A0ACB8S084_9AGAM|nr:hypothetical protein FA95DRAFT_1651004 [Auriscalpium vulgare]
MVDWHSPAELARDADAFSKLIHSLLGLYIWEFVTSLDFDIAFITRKRVFRWPLTFYFLGRYCLLAALIGMYTCAQAVSRKINCQGLYTFNQCMGNLAIGLASVNLSLRTMAVWGQRWYIVVPLTAIILGHWSLLLHGILLTAAWVPEAGCVITSTDSRILSVTFIYSMSLDLLVLILTGWKLAHPSSSGKSKLVDMIFTDGLVYFIIAFLANLIATIFMTLNLNAVMSIIANVPAAIASTIVASRVVRRLANFSNDSAEMFATTTTGSSFAFRPSQRSAMQPNVSLGKQQPSGVHVQMNSFSAADPMAIQYDAAGRIVKEDHYDPEAQIISDEFKRPPY